MDERVGSFIFSLIFFIVFFALWYNAFFQKGAKKWSEKSIHYQKKILRLFFIKDIEKRFKYVLHPIAYKLFTSLMLIVALFIVYKASSSLFNW